jgi:hypothetical protein
MSKMKIPVPGSWPEHTEDLKGISSAQIASATALATDGQI